MNPDYTDITLVVDRSGSMQAIREDAEGGVNAFVEQQAGEPGEARLTLVQFDTEYEFLHHGTPIGDVGPYTLAPRGATALLDAVGRAINETGSRLAAMPEADRPGLVVFVVVTDGQENSSREFSLERVREMIEHQQSVYGWQFTFLAADPAAFAAGMRMGFETSGSAPFDPTRYSESYAVTGAKVARMRKQRSGGAPVDNAFTEEERKQMS